MVSRPPSPRVQELIREGARIALDPSKEWLDEFDRAMLYACPLMCNDPDLAIAVTRSNRTHFAHFATANLHNPGAPVPPQINAETLRTARDLVRHGLDTSALEVYRIGHSMAWRRWTEIAFELTSDPAELRDLLEVPFRSANEFVDATLAGLAAQMQSEYAELTQDIDAERRTMVELILDGASISCARAEAFLDYSFDQSHTAAILWCDDPNADHSRLDRAAEAFSNAAGCTRPLTVITGPMTRWVWVTDVATLTNGQLHQALASTPEVRIAIGNPAPDLDGFRRSHGDALTTQRMLTRLQSPQRVAFFADTQMIALLTENPRGADSFIKAVLGEFETASSMLHTTVSTYINTQCNASRAAKHLYTHRNTLVYRLEAAQRLLPHPLDDTIILVAVALEALRWRGNHTSDSTSTLPLPGSHART